MKITDYGLWFENVEIKALTKKITGFSNTYLNGNFVSSGYTSTDQFAIFIDDLNKMGFKINQKSPGELVGGVWYFPTKHSPTDSDFVEIE